MRHRPGPQAENHRFQLVRSRRRFRLDHILAKLEQDTRDVDLNRTHLGACSTQARRKRQPRILLDSVKLRCQDRSDRARVHPGIIVPANLAIHRTMIQACPATDAIQRLALAFVGQHFGAAVVEQDQIELVRPINFARPPGTAHERRVNGHRLSRGAAPQDGQENRQILRPRNDLLNAGDRNVDFRRRMGQPRVALIFDHHHGSRIGYHEVRAGDPDVRVEELLPQDAACDHRLIAGLGLRAAQLLLEYASHVMPGVMQRWGDDVIGPLIGELQDVLAQIGLDGFQIVGLEPRVQVDLLGRHRLRLHKQFRALLFGERQDEIGDLGGVLGKDDFAPVSLHVALD